MRDWTTGALRLRADEAYQIYDHLLGKGVGREAAAALTHSTMMSAVVETEFARLSTQISELTDQLQTRSQT